MADDTLKRLIELGVNATPAIREMEKVAKETAKTTQGIEGIQKSLDSFATGIKGVFAGLAIGALIGETISGIKGLIDELDRFDETAQGLQVTTEFLSGMQYAAQMSGVKAEQLTQALTTLNDKVGQLNQSTDASSKILKNFGVTATDDTAAALAKIADGFAQAENGPLKTAYAVELFGKRIGTQLIPFLNEGSAGLAKLTAEAQRLGLVIDTDTAAKAAKFNDDLDRLKGSLKSVGIGIVSEMLPALNKMAEALMKNIKEWGVFSGIMQTVMEGVFGTAQENMEKGWRKSQENLTAMQTKLRQLEKDPHTAASVAASELRKSIDATSKAVKQQGDAVYEGWLKAAKGANTYDKTLKGIPGVGTGTGTKKLDDSVFAKGGGGGGTKALKESKDAFDQWVESIKKGQEAIDLTPRKIEYLTNALADLDARGLGASEAAKKLTEELRKVEPDAVGDAFDKILKAANEMDTTPGVIANIKKELVEMTLAGNGASAAAVKLHDKLLELEAAGDPAKQVTLELKKMNAELEKNAALEAAWFNALGTGQANSAQFVQGVNKYLDKTNEQLDKTTEKTKTLGQAVEEMGAKFVTDFIDEMVDGFGKADQSFADMIESMLKQLAKLILQMQAAELIKNAGGSSGWMSGIAGWFSGGGASVQSAPMNDDLLRDGGILARRSGGVRVGDSTTSSSAGESRPHDQSASPFGASPVNITINNSTDSQVRATSKDNSDGTRQIDIYVERKVREMMGNGSLDRTMRSSYGVARQPSAG